jgi:hypothetical protein
MCSAYLIRHTSSFKILFQVTANIIEMYPSSSLFIAIGQLAIAILVLFSYPLQVQPCRSCLDKVFHFGTVNDKVVEDDDVEDEHGSGEMTPLKHTVLTSAVVAGGFSVAYFVDNLEMGARVFLRDLASLSGLTMCSAVVCRGHRVDDYLVHPPWTVLLESKYPSKAELDINFMCFFSVDKGRSEQE